MADAEEIARGLDDRRYWGPDWLTANARTSAHPAAADLIVSRYSVRQWKDARRTAVCAAGLNTPLWQQAVREAYPGLAVRTILEQERRDAE